MAISPHHFPWGDALSLESVCPAGGGTTLPTILALPLWVGQARQANLPRPPARPVQNPPMPPSNLHKARTISPITLLSPFCLVETKQIDLTDRSFIPGSFDTVLVLEHRFAQLQLGRVGRDVWVCGRVTWRRWPKERWVDFRVVLQDTSWDALKVETGGKHSQPKSQPTKRVSWSKTHQRRQCTSPSLPFQLPRPVQLHHPQAPRPSRASLAVSLYPSPRHTRLAQKPSRPRSVCAFLTQGRAIVGVPRASGAGKCAKCREASFVGWQ